MLIQRVMDIKISQCLDNINKLINYKKSLLEKYKGSRATLYITSEINTLCKISELLSDLAREVYYNEKEIKEQGIEIKTLTEELEINKGAYKVVSELFYKQNLCKTQEEEEIVQDRQIRLLKEMKVWKQKRMQSTNN